MCCSCLCFAEPQCRGPRYVHSQRLRISRRRPCLIGSGEENWDVLRLSRFWPHSKGCEWPQYGPTAGLIANRGHPSHSKHSSDGHNLLPLGVAVEMSGRLISRIGCRASSYIEDVLTCICCTSDCFEKKHRPLTRLSVVAGETQSMMISSQVFPFACAFVPTPLAWISQLILLHRTSIVDPLSFPHIWSVKE